MIKWVLIIGGGIILLAGVFYFGMRTAVKCLFDMTLAIFGFVPKNRRKE